MDFLVDIISRESQKPDEEANLFLIDECSKLLEALVGDEACIPVAELQKRVDHLNQIKRKSNRVIKTRRIPIRIAAALCAVLLMICSVGAVFVINEDLRNNIMIALGLDVGDSHIVDGVEYINSGVSRKYDTIEELLTVEGLSVKYPKDLPDTLVLERISVAEIGIYPIIFSYNDGTCGMGIYLNGAKQIEGVENGAAQQTINGMTFHIRKIAELWIALFFDEDHTYYFSCQTEEQLMLLLENFK